MQTRILNILLSVLILVSPSTAFSEVLHLNLNGDWDLFKIGENQPIPAKVPGNVHTDLLSAGKIPDPFFRDNEQALEWVYQATWIYKKSFQVPESLLKEEKIFLRCEGLDTVATLKINEKLVGKTDNMFRIWEFDAKPFLHAGENNIEVTFFPIGPYIAEFKEKAPKIPNATGKDIANIRKAPYSGGWDFGPKFLTAGIYKNIELVAFSKARINDIILSQNLENPASAQLKATVVAETATSQKLTLAATVKFEGKIVASTETNWNQDQSDLTLSISNPKLWWPNGMGEHPLYQVDVELKSSDGKIVDQTSRRIGLRKVELLPKTQDRPLRLAVNGKEFFAKGANWIPSDSFPARVTPEKLRRYIGDAASVGMNMIRMWAGGYYEDDAFYDACDEQGILLWNDLIFACAAYPAYHPDFQKNVQAELKDQIRRLRHHPSIALVSGNNEVIMLIKEYKLITQEQYDFFFHEQIGKTLAKLAPDISYVGGSPEMGDEHNWWIWHVGANYEKYRESHGWMTEFGFQSFPEPSTVYSYTDPEDRDSVLNKINSFHQRNGLKPGNPMILDKMKQYFRPPKDFDATLWLSQINQAYAMEIGIEHWRTDWPDSSGCFVWQYNDCWPGPTWSAVDYYGRWKALQYRFRRLYAPIMVTGLIKPKTSEVQIKIASELEKETPAKIEWTLTDTKGQKLDVGATDIKLPAGVASTQGPLLSMENQIQKIGSTKALLWLKVTTEDQTSSKCLAFVRPKDLELVNPDLTVKIAIDGPGFDVTVQANHPSLWTWITCADADARYSNNFFDIASGESATVKITPSHPMTLDELKKSLKVQSLFDTYSPTDSAK